MKNELFVIIETGSGFNITLPGGKVNFFAEDIKTLKELFKQMSELANR